MSINGWETRGRHAGDPETEVIPVWVEHTLTEFSGLIGQPAPRRARRTWSTPARAAIYAAVALVTAGVYVAVLCAVAR